MITLTIALVVGPPSVAAAAPVDTASERVALRAYERYLGAAVAAVPAARSSSDALVASIAAGCPNVLAALNGPAPSQSAGTLFAIGEEIGADLQISQRASIRNALAALTSAVAPLRWSEQRWTTGIRRSLRAQRLFILQRPSDLCADAQAVAATNGQTTPPATLKFLATTSAYAKGSGLSALTDAIQHFETVADGRAIDRINRLLKRVKSASTALYKAESPKLLTVMGITP